MTSLKATRVLLYFSAIVAVGALGWVGVLSRPTPDRCAEFYEQGLKAAYGFRENMGQIVGDVYLREALLWLAVHQSCVMEEGRR